jgi:hypothetical protein
VQAEPNHSLASQPLIWKEGESARTYTFRACREGFGFELREDQWQALSHFVWEKRDLVLVAKTSFGKSLLFQIAPLLLRRGDVHSGIILCLMPLNLLISQQDFVGHLELCCAGWSPPSRRQEDTFCDVKDADGERGAWLAAGPATPVAGCTARTETGPLWCSQG